ncbi:MAG: leucine-rich repeat domain-containing protein [Phycisphaerae bacterium]
MIALMLGELATIATLSKTLADWLKLRKDRKAGAKQQTIQDYLEWLRRKDHADLAERVQSSHELLEQIEGLINREGASSRRQIEAVLQAVSEQSSKINGLPGRIREELAQEVDRLIDSHKSRPEQPQQSDEDKEYERVYRKALQSALDEVELFGADLSPESKRHKLSVVYVSLSLGGLEDADATGPTPAETVLDMLRPRTGRLLIRGDAGCGKSTLLRWIAIRAADETIEFGRKAASETLLSDLRNHVVHRNAAGGKSVQFAKWAKAVISTRPDQRISASIELRDFLSYGPSIFWQTRIPLLVLIRQCRKGAFPDLQAIPTLAAPAAGEPPPGWTRRVLESGRAIVLVDGIDETPPTYRSKVRNLLKQLTETYPDCYFVVTTRPAAVPKNWLADLEFKEANVAPMTADDRDRFVDRWHTAVHQELEHRRRKEDTQELAEKLKLELRSNPAIARLATNPLLAAMICALHRDRRSRLPERQYELVEALCHMLLFRRELESGLDLSEFPTAYRVLSYPQRRAILQRLAEYMVRQEVSAVDVAKARSRIEDELRSIPGRAKKDALAVLAGLVERSGMLCKKTHDSLDFVHNTFKEYLAARQFVHNDDMKTLGDKSLTGDWDDVLLFAAATPEKREFASELVDRVLSHDDGGKLSRRKTPSVEDVHRYRCRLMAVRLLAVAEHLDERITKRVRGLERQVFPPRTLSAAAALAACGSGFERYLRRSADMGIARKVCCIRALRLMGTDAAEQELEQYKQETNWKVVMELAQAVNPLEIPEVLTRFVQEGKVDFVYHESNLGMLARISDLTPLAGLTSLTSLNLTGTRVSDLTPLAGLTSLTRIDLTDTLVSDLTSLAGLASLRSLKLWHTQVSDLTPLIGLTSLTTLDLDQTPVSDLKPLAGLTSLAELLLWGTSVFDLTPLLGLTSLTSLNLNDTHVSDLTPLAGLESLQSLRLRSTQVSDLTPLAGLTSLTMLILMGTRVSDIEPLAGLTALSVLDLRSTGVMDLAPIRGLPNVKVFGP